MMMKTSDKRVFAFYVGLSAGLVLFLRQALVAYWEARSYLASLNLCFSILLLGTLVLIWFAYLLQMVAWVIILRYLGIDFDLNKTIQGYWWSLLPRYIPGSIWGYWSRSQWLEQTWGIEHKSSIIASILEILALIIAAISISITCVSIDLTNNYCVAFTTLSLCLILLMCLRYLMLKGQKLLLKKLEMIGPLEILRKHSPLSLLLLAVSLYMVIWITYGSAISLITSTINPALGNLPRSILAVSISWFLGFIVFFVPTGLGVRELALSTLMELQFNLTPAQASLVAVVFRVEIILSEILWLLIGLVVYAANRKGQK
jgi:hypothetical protein